MKVLKKILCCLVVLPVVFSFVACKKNDDGNGGGNNPPAELSIAQILNAVCDKVVAVSGSENGDLGYQEDGVYAFEQYDKYVYVSAKMISAIASVESLKNNVWIDSAQEILDGKSGYAEKVSRFKINQTEQNGQVDIVIDLVFEIEGKAVLSNPETFDLWHYDIEYNRESGEVEFDVFIEKSRNYQNTLYQQDNKSNYVKIEFSESMIDIVSFAREAELADIDNLDLYTKNTITNFSFLRFNFKTKAVLTDELIYPANSPNLFAKAQSLVSDFVEIGDDVLSSPIYETNETLTSKLIGVANAEKIADIL